MVIRTHQQKRGKSVIKNKQDYGLITIIQSYYGIV
ncbi:hypothetical protein cce_2113 [Crocosphaera subtropica ATCC 51142]|uniref:Uncharacterized protein n=1 Tax=Crocosphaera subtropica (strain ATCC 51142 / BH68) TaxID=43989 RepID=B1WNN4_CROS5|nr:hypothetical protein cce_2113 [Crocosphaera subtropica ATCC 51142]